MFEEVTARVFLVVHRKHQTYKYTKLSEPQVGQIQRDTFLKISYSYPWEWKAEKLQAEVNSVSTGSSIGVTACLLMKKGDMLNVLKGTYCH